MKYILLIIFLVTPPNAINPRDKGTVRDKRVWALQSTTTMELSSKEWCKAIADNIDSSMFVTNTITTRMFCIPKDERDFIASQTQDKAIQGLQEFKSQLGRDRKTLEDAIDREIRSPPK
jgi:hypothetical protein